MNITYVAYLDESLDAASWMRFVDDAPSGLPVSTPVNELLQEANGQKLLLVLPATMVTLMNAEVTARSEKQLEAALPFALEDALAEDVEALHCALVVKNAPGEVTAAVIRRAIMQQLFDELSGYAYQWLRLVPETAFSPRQADDWSLVIGEHVSAFAKGNSTLYGFDTDNIMPLLETEALNDGSEHGVRSVSVRDFRHQGNTLLEIKHIEWKPEAILSPNPMAARLSWYLDGSASAPLDAFNLLRGAYTIYQPVVGQRRNWSIATGLATIALSLYIVSLGVERQHLSEQRDALNAQMSSLYAQLFPDEMVADSPYTEMQKRLVDLKRKTGTVDEPFLTYIAVSGKHLGNLPADSIESLRFRNAIIEIDIKAGSIEKIEELQRKMKQDALKVELKAITTDGKNVRGRLLISGSERA